MLRCPYMRQNAVFAFCVHSFINHPFYACMGVLLDGVRMNEKIYHTKQRAFLLECLKDNAGKHMTADEIMEELKCRNTPVGKATVYRYLEVLEREGSIRKYVIEEGKGACYEFIGDGSLCSRHFHLKCSRCQKLYHISCEYMQGLNAHVLEKHGFLIDNSKTVFYGICEDCSREPGKEKRNENRK